MMTIAFDCCSAHLISVSKKAHRAGQSKVSDLFGPLTVHENWIE